MKYWKYKTVIFLNVIYFNNFPIYKRNPYIFQSDRAKNKYNWGKMKEINEFERDKNNFDK